MTRTVRDLVVPLAASVLILSSLSRPAEASLIGDSVTCDGGLSLTCSPPTATVTDPGFSEFNSIAFVISPFPRFFSADIKASSITLIARVAGLGLGGSFDLTFGDLDSSVGDIVGVSLATSAGVAGLTSTDITFTAHSVAIDLGGTSWTDNGATAPPDFAVISLSFANDAAVPAPATLLLLLAGTVAGIGVSRVRRRR